MKKAGAIFILFLLFLPLVMSLVLAQEETPNAGLPITQEQVDNARAFIENESKWEYLSRAWPEALLKNDIVKSINNFCQKINIVFRVLFGENYSFSLGLIAVMFFWVWVAFKIAEFPRAFGMLKGLMSYLFGFAFSTILAQIRLYRIITDFLGQLVFSRDKWWARAIVIIVIIAVLWLIDYLNKYLANYLKQMKEQRWREDVDLKGKKTDIIIAKVAK